MRITSSVLMSPLHPLARVALILVVACQQQPATTPDAEASASESTETASAAPVAVSPERAAELAAQSRADAWLALVDQGQYDASWDAAAAVFQSSTSKEQWHDALKGARGPLGPLSSRQFRVSEYKAALPGAPEGKYVVVYYDSAFAQKSSAREIVTLRQAADESWKVAGYFVQ